MAATGGAGIWGFAPQYIKGSTPSNWYRHKATAVDMGWLDDTRLGRLEVGAGPWPTFPYKAGYYVGGAVSIQPRLENTLGWLLEAALGSINAESPAGTPTLAHAEITVASLPTQLVVNTVLTQPDQTFGQEAVVQLTTLVGAGTLVVHVIGTAFPAGGALDCTFTLTAATANSYTGATVRTSKFKSITSITVDGLIGENGDKIKVFWTNGIQHDFSPDGTDPSLVKWMGMRKMIPQVDGVAGTDLGEIYVDCKPLGFMLALANDAPLEARIDTLGRDVTLDASPSAWTWANSFEHWNSIPVGCEVDGYIDFTGGGSLGQDFNGQELPVVAASVGWVNTPLDLRQEKIYGSPTINDITIVSRQMTFDIAVKWENADLYRAIHTGAKAGTSWSPKPLTGSLAVQAISPTSFSGTQNYALKMTSSEIMWTMNGTPTLVAGQAVLMRFTGIAIEPVAGKYATISLINDVGLNGYKWPSS